MPMQSSDPVGDTLLGLIIGQRVTAVLHVAAKLGIADLLVESPKTVVELSRLAGADQRSLFRLMRGLVALDICTEAEDGRFQLTDMGARLAAKSERSLKAWALFEGTMEIVVAWGGLSDSIRTGKTTDELAGLGQNRFDRPAKPKEAIVFNEAMASLTRIVLPDLLAACDFSGVSTLMDVGGGVGDLMSAILMKYRSMHGIVLDLPHCAQGAKENLAAAGVAERAEFIGGNFFESVPRGGDAIVLKSIIHDWNDERCAQILSNCHSALKFGDRLTVIDRVLPKKLEPKPDHLEAVLSDLTMLRGLGGCERTENEHRELLEKSGFLVTRVVPAGRYSLIEATVV